jgi:hypothetical protein
MKIGVNRLHQIKQIKEITDVTLRQIYIDESSDIYPFKNWPDAKILCYCYKESEQGISIYPYIDTNIIEKIEADSTTINDLTTRLDLAEQALDFMIMGGV